MSQSQCLTFSINHHEDSLSVDYEQSPTITQPSSTNPWHSVAPVGAARGGNGHGLLCTRLPLCHHLDPQHDTADAWHHFDPNQMINELSSESAMNINWPSISHDSGWSPSYVSISDCESAISHQLTTTLFWWFHGTHSRCEQQTAEGLVHLRGKWIRVKWSDENDDSTIVDKLFSITEISRLNT